MTLPQFFTAGIALSSMNAAVMKISAKFTKPQLAKGSAYMQEALQHVLQTFTPPRNIFLWHGLKGDAMRDILQMPWGGILECNNSTLDDLCSHLPDDLAQNEWFAGFSSRSAFEIPLAQQIASMLALRLNLQELHAQKIAQCMHEAMVHIVLHGNLGLETYEDSSVQKLGEWCQRVQQALRDPKLGEKYLWMQVWCKKDILRVRISGDQSNAKNAPSPAADSGHGLMLLAKNCTTWEYAGNSFLLGFDLSGMQAAPMPVLDNEHTWYKALPFIGTPKVAGKVISPAVLQAKILICEDQITSRDLIHESLKKKGFLNIHLAQHGLEALQKISELRPDVILLDVLMPYIDGYELCKMLRADPSFANTVVLMQTVIESDEARNKAFAVGATDYITKPINRTELVSRIVLHLENKLLIEGARELKEAVGAI